MSSTQLRRLYLLLVLALSVAVVVALVLYALRQNINLFFTPHELRIAQLPHKAKIRVGGMVLQGSVVRSQNLQVNFKITDYKSDLAVSYTGMLPDLFREGQGVVVFGSLVSDGSFKADQILAKHDQNYMPPELTDKLTGVQDVT